MQDTLFTPKTSYPMKGNLAQKEPELQKDNRAVYEQLIEENKKSGREFYLHDGPPYANGDLHIGHALNKILKDFIIRSKLMQGYYAPYIMGWDTHGLPIENALNKNKKIKSKDLTTNEFRDLCKSYAGDQVQNQKEQFLRLGVLTNPDNYYVTYSKDYEAQQIKVFAKMVEEGMIFKGLKPVYWSPTSHSALAEAEVEYHEKKSPAIYVAFNLKDSDVSVVIWTTTPWTIPANQGISAGEDIEYSVIQFNSNKYMIATSLIENFVNELEIEDYTVIDTFKGKDLEGKGVIHPLNVKEFKIMLGDHVSEDSGTGFVHTAPGHGEDDFNVGMKYNLDVVSVVDAYGKMINTGKYDGMFYEDANKEISHDLEEAGALLKLSFIKHSYPHDWRTKKPIIFRATEQWFASIDKDKKGMLNAIKDVKWINSWGEKRLYNMIADRKDWCISRQRKWGVPIPIIYMDGEPVFEKEVFEHISNLFLNHGSNIWYDREAKDLLPDSFVNNNTGASFEKELDIMDVWFDSGVSFSAVMKQRLNVDQSDIYLEGSDQYRGWFNSSLINSYITTKKSPYKSALSHGFVLDAKGQKMSKSLGNTITPKQIYQKYGADILRLWVSTVDYQSDVRVSDDIIKQVTEIYRRMRNSFRFVLGNLNDGQSFDESNLVEFIKLNDVDKYILCKLEDIVRDSVDHYNNYEFKKIIDQINNFITFDLSAFYFDFIKDVLYIKNPNDPEVLQIKTVLHIVFRKLLIVLNPIIPHTCLETWNYLFKGHIMHEKIEYNSELLSSENEEVIDKVEKIIYLRDIVNKQIEELREQKVVGKSLECTVDLNIQDDKYNIYREIKDLPLYLIVSNVEFVDDLPITEGGIGVRVSKYSDHRCERCWKYYDKSELNDDHVCKSCEEIMSTL